MSGLGWWFDRLLAVIALVLLVLILNRLDGIRKGDLYVLAVNSQTYFDGIAAILTRIEGVLTRIEATLTRIDAYGLDVVDEGKKLSSQQALEELTVDGTKLIELPFRTVKGIIDDLVVTKRMSPSEAEKALRLRQRTPSTRSTDQE